MRTSKDLVYYFLLLLIVIVSFAARFAILNRHEVLPGADYGNYLTQVDILQGFDVTGSGLRYNPLFFVVLAVFLRLFDEFLALKIVASLVFSVIAIPFFLVAKKLSNNPMASLIATWFFVFFEAYSEMIAWGGNPNFLGLSFLLLSLVFLLASIDEPSRKNLLLAGIFLSLTVGTHFLVAIFTFVSILVFAVLMAVFRRAERNKIARVVLLSFLTAAVLSLPYFPVYSTFLRESSRALVEFDISYKLDRLSFDFLWMFKGDYFAILIITGLGALALFQLIRQRKIEGLMLSGLLLTPFMLALGADQPSRFFYFLPIPIMLCLGLYLKNLLAAVRKAKIEIVLVAVCLIFIIGVDTTSSSMNRLETSADYYRSIWEDELLALRWIKENTPTSAVFATSGPNRIIGAGAGNSYSWWIEGYSKRKSIPAGYPRFFTYQDEREEVEIANRIFAGGYCVEEGNVRMAESFPSGMGNPGIGAFVDGQYQNVLLLNDGEQEVVFSPITNESLVWREAPYYASTKTSSMTLRETLANASFTYEWSYLKMTRNVLVGADQESVDVVFEILPINSTLKRFTVNLRTSYFTSLENYEITNSTIILQQKLSFERTVKTKITIVQTNCELNETKVTFKDPLYSMPVATYSLVPLQNNVFLHVRIQPLIEKSENSSQTLSFYDSYKLIEDYDVGYIFLNKDRINEYQRFLCDPQHFVKVFENGTIIIFKVASRGK